MKFNTPLVLDEYPEFVPGIGDALTSPLHLIRHQNTTRKICASDDIRPIITSQSLSCPNSKLSSTKFGRPNIHLPALTPVLDYFFVELCSRPLDLVDLTCDRTYDPRLPTLDPHRTEL